MSNEYENNELTTNEVSETNDTNETKTTNPTDYKLIVDMMKEMDEQYKFLKQMGEDTIRTAYNLKPDVLIAVIPLTDEDIEKMSDEEISEFVSQYILNPNESTSDNLQEMMKEIKKTSMSIFSAKAEAEEIRKESETILNDYFNYLSSPKIQEHRLKRLAVMKEEAEKTNDADKKREMLRMINTMEASYTLSFLFTRFDTLGKKEVKSIMDSFFDEQKGKNIIERYKKRISKFGFATDLYKYFFNIEENFLGEEYFPFNNLFLFIFMRTVVHSDPYSKTDKMYIQSLVSSLANLIYHKFDSTTNEQNFIAIVKKVVDNFVEYKDYFVKNNTTAPNHPKRIEADNNMNQARREALMKKMDELKITGYDENASADDLQTYMNAELDRMVHEQMKEKLVKTAWTEESGNYYVINDDKYEYYDSENNLIESDVDKAVIDEKVANNTVTLKARKPEQYPTTTEENPDDDPDDEFIIREA